MAVEVRPFTGDPRASAHDGDRIVGTAGIFSFELTVPGGVLPAAGVTFVGVHATRRRRTSTSHGAVSGRHRE